MPAIKRPRKTAEDLRKSLTKELKSFASFDWWPGADVQATYQERRLLSEFDLDPQDSAAWAELDREIETWLEETSSVPDEMSWGDEFEGGLQRLAWYQPITFHGPDAGIFVTTRGVLIYARRFLQGFRGMKVLPQYPHALAMKIAIACLLAHEAFHHNVESFALKLSATVGTSNLYARYHRDVYLPNTRPLNDDLLEEALASANEVRKFKAYLDGGLVEDVDVASVVSQTLLAGYSSRPPGYRLGAHVDVFFKEASYDLIRQIAEGRLVTHSFNVPSHFPISKGRLHDVFVDNAVLVDNLPGANSSIFTLAVPSHSLERYVRSLGFVEQPRRGKGSHSVWKGPSGEMITLPHRKDQQGFNTLKSAATTLGFASARELAEAVRL
jgi:predicted RNA binding protein YcfA (HicA-like mRNA interferase family)